VLEQLIFSAEAEARWLDHCEARLVRLAESIGRADDDAPKRQADSTDSATHRPARR
jgi:hypothetical protein